MPSGKKGYEPFDGDSLIAGALAFSFTRTISRHYRSSPSASKALWLRTAMFIAPTLCGGIGYSSWKYLLSAPIKKRKLESVCN